MTGPSEPAPLAAAGLPAITGPRARQIAAIRAEARAACAARRARVLRYPDLVAAMAGPPLHLDAFRWNGYVPPGTGQEQLPEVLHSGGALGRGYPNRDTRMTGPTELNICANRQAFVEICAEAYRRDAEAGRLPAPDPAPDPDPAPEPVDLGPVQDTLGGWPDGSIGQVSQ